MIRYRSLGFWGEIRARDTYLLFSDTEVVFKAMGLNAIPKATRKGGAMSMKGLWRRGGGEARTATWERDRVACESICVLWEGVTKVGLDIQETHKGGGSRCRSREFTPYAGVTSMKEERDGGIGWEELQTTAGFQERLGLAREDLLIQCVY